MARFVAWSLSEKVIEGSSAPPSAASSMSRSAHYASLGHFRHLCKAMQDALTPGGRFEPVVS